MARNGDAGRGGRGHRSAFEHPLCRPRRTLGQLVGLEARNLALPGDGLGACCDSRGGTLCVAYSLWAASEDGGRGQLFHASEGVPAVCNPEWHPVDHARAPRELACHTGRLLLEVRVVRVGSSAQRFVLRAAVDLDGLLYAGPSFPAPARHFPANTVVFQLHDGFYVAPQHAAAFALEPPEADALLAECAVPPAAEDDRIADDLVAHSAEVRAEGVRLPLDKYLAVSVRAAHLRRRRDAARLHEERASAAVVAAGGEDKGANRKATPGDAQRLLALRHVRAKRVEELRRRVSSAAAAAAARREEAVAAQSAAAQRHGALRHARRELEAARARLGEADALLRGDGGHGALLAARRELHVRRWALVREVGRVYPVVKECFDPTGAPLAAGALSAQFSIAGVCLNFTRPTAENGSGGLARGAAAARAAGSAVAATPEASAAAADMEPDQLVAVAFGYVSHAVTLLARYLGVNPRYPLRAAASRSAVCDMIVRGRADPSVAPSRRSNTAQGAAGGARAVQVSLPLHAEAGVDPSRFAFAVVLLNKDIEQMLQKFGLSGLGPKHTLHNVNTILEAAAACKQGG